MGECLVQGDDDYPEVGVGCPNPTPCTLQKCANFPMCGSKLPLWLLQCKGGRCIQPCDMMYGRSFEFFALDEPCPVCFNAAESFMKYPCGHPICPSCFYPEYPPEPFEHGLEEPDIHKWELEHPDQYAEWRAAVDKWADHDAHMDLMKKCPLCRTPGIPVGTDAHWKTPRGVFKPRGA